MKTLQEFRETARHFTPQVAADMTGFDYSDDVNSVIIYTDQLFIEVRETDTHLIIGNIDWIDTRENNELRLFSYFYVGEIEQPETESEWAEFSAALAECVNRFDEDGLDKVSIDEARSWMEDSV